VKKKKELLRKWPLKERANMKLKLETKKGGADCEGENQMAGKGNDAAHLARAELRVQTRG